jgi:hypothetical protein
VRNVCNSCNGVTPFNFGRLTLQQLYGLSGSDAENQDAKREEVIGGGLDKRLAEAKKRLEAKTGRTAFGLNEVFDEVNRGV